MRGSRSMLLLLLVGILACLGAVMVVEAEDPYRYFTWVVTYGTISPLGKPQQGILINGQFPGPRLDCVTNDNVIINVINKIDQPFLLTWNGIKNRKSSYQDGTLGTNCPIPPGRNFTYHLQVKDQIGTFMYFPSTQMHKASGGFGGINMYTRPKIPLPFAEPADDFHLLLGDWYKAGHKALQNTLDSGKKLAFPDGLLINGKQKGIKFTGDPGKTYMIRLSNVGLSTSINFRIQGHKMKLVEMGGSHTVQETYSSLDIHVGQSMSVLVTLNQQARDYFIVASSRFTSRILTSTGYLTYSNSKVKASGALPVGPTTHVPWSIKQARSFRCNLTASAARPNPQGTYHYGSVKITTTIKISNSEAKINGKLRYAINGMSYVNPDTPLKLADYFNIPGVFDLKSFNKKTAATTPKFGTPVIDAQLHDFVEVIFSNKEDTIQSWYTAGNDFWVAGYGPLKWTVAQRKHYNLVDAPKGYTIQVYPKSWTAILMPLDNKGMWNLRSQIWPRRYLGQELYVKVWNNERSLYTEYDIPKNALLCGKARGVLACLGAVMVVEAEDPYRYFTWVVTYGTISPLGTPQQGILINGQFPGPRLDIVTNDNVIINVINKIDQPFLLTWNGIKNRKSSWQDGTLGTNCPIPPGRNFTYHVQVKDQIGTFMYFPSLLMQKASGGFGGINMYTRPKIPLPFAEPAGDFHLLLSDWYKAGHKALQNTLDSGRKLAFPDGLLINGVQRGIKFTGDPGKTYMIRLSNVGLSTSINFRIQGHNMKLVEMGGSHTIQETYDSFDIHVGQSLSVLVTLNQRAKDYFIAASSRFTSRVLTSTGYLTYSNSQEKASGAMPIGPSASDVAWSMKQARSFRCNMTASAARPNPQGTYHYGSEKIVATYRISNSEAKINGKLRYAINGISYINPDTPLKLADYFNIPGVFDLKSFNKKTAATPAKYGTPVIGAQLHDFVEIIFSNKEDTIQSWYLAGNDFWIVGFGPLKWTAAHRKNYNAVDAPKGYTIQVYPKSWTAILVSLDNKGMWNLRSQIWPRRYLGQELYVKVWNNERSLYTEYNIPKNALLCGKARGQHT
ncbi:hypothetical protein MKW94_020564 [Papaver nudicaule]|uniref:L-ascorbate oxidase n=1 Tax=Papaver nudicaule TaxID=74823 RepID=A0AA41S5K7_PAPNU|nr:hypothetical protein [Papaver nudicaule]